MTFKDGEKPEAMIYKNLTNNETGEKKQIIYTYSVRVLVSDLEFQHRFDHYVKTGKDVVHNLQFHSQQNILAVQQEKEVVFLMPTVFFEEFLKN